MLPTDALLGRGQVIDLQQTSITGAAEPAAHPVCMLTVRVFLDDAEPFEARCRQTVPLALVPQLASGQLPVAVRVDPRDHSVIALDLRAEPPTVRLPASAPSGSASEIIATGRAARVTIVQSAPTGLRSAAGVDVHSFVLTVSLEGQAPYQCQTAQPVPPEALALDSSRLDAGGLRGDAQRQRRGDPLGRGPHGRARSGERLSGATGRELRSRRRGAGRPRGRAEPADRVRRGGPWAQRRGGAAAGGGETSMSPAPGGRCLLRLWRRARRLSGRRATCNPGGMFFRLSGRDRPCAGG